METKSLVIKGNRFEAAKAAASRGVPFIFDREFSGKGEPNTVGRTTVDVNTLNAWFCEPPYTGLMPIGTLLLWTPGGTGGCPNV